MSFVGRRTAVINEKVGGIDDEDIDIDNGECEHSCQQGRTLPNVEKIILFTFVRLFANYKVKVCL